MRLVEVVVGDAARACSGGVAGCTARGTSSTEPPVRHAPVVSPGAGETVGGVCAGRAAGIAGIANVVDLVEAGEALSAESVAVDFEAAGTDDAAPRVEECV